MFLAQRRTAVPKTSYPRRKGLDAVRTRLPV